MAPSGKPTLTAVCGKPAQLNILFTIRQSMSNEPRSVDDEFAWLLAEFDAASQRNGVEDFWKNRPCSEQMRQRVELAHQSLQVNRTHIAPNITLVDSNLNLATLHTGQVKLERFQLIRELGRGGFGIVYLANDPKLNRLVAIKIPRFESVHNATLRKRFSNEAEIAASLDHAYILPLFEVGESQGNLFLVSLFCPGTNLAQWLKEHGDQLTISQIVELMICLSDAMAYCHYRNVLHRDLKPANVLLFPTEHSQLPFLPRLSDFGLAKVLESTLNETGSSVLVGTLLYMSPEQAWSRSEEISAATDVYALGAIFYELLTGRTPFEPASIAVMLDQIRTKSPMAPSKLKQGIPKELELICLKCLAKEPADRYASAQFLLDDLRTFVNGGAVLAKRPSLRRRVARWCEQPARLRESGLAILFANLVIMGTMIIIVLMERFQLIPRSTPNGLLPIVSCTAIMCVIHLPLLFVATFVAQGKIWAGIVSLLSGCLLTLIFACCLLGWFATDEVYWNDIPGFRVVYSGFCMLAMLQVAASIVGLCAMNTERFRRGRTTTPTTSGSGTLRDPSRQV